MATLELEIHKTLVLSTGHYQEADNRLLNSHLPGIITYPKISNWDYANRVGDWVMVPDTASDVEDLTDRLRRAGFSSAFIELIRLAQRQDCNWIMFDADGPVYDGLPTFDW